MFTYIFLYFYILCSLCRCLFTEAMDFQGKIVFDSTKSDGQFKKTACNDKLMSFYPDCQFTSIEDGLKASCDWFVANYEKARKGH